MHGSSWNVREDSTVCMGHHRFDITLNSKSSEIETDLADQIEGMDMNGLRRVTQEHQQLLEQTRRRLRDRISSRMGELLLLGQTMLNEYCELCAGILMEDRQGVRCCVACDMVNLELSRGQNNRISVSSNVSDDLNDPNAIATEDTNINRSDEISHSSDQLFSADSPTRSLHSATERESLSVRTADTCRLLVENRASAHLDFTGSKSIKTAVQAVDDKLKWCAERLKSCEDVEEVIKLYETIDRGIRILKHFST
uniref:Uncharacterized protein n=1 Tax=Setaria digitata TaxID=48799 RepID=A0A915PVQ7_9BILA